MSSVLGRGVYTVPQAAKLVGLSPNRVREWFRGRRSEPGRKPVFLSDYGPVDNFFAISFFDLIDVFVAGQLREHGVSLPTLRRVYSRLEHDLKTRHPFCRQELLTDGEQVFVRSLDRVGDEEIYEVLTKQKVFPKLILPFLRQIDYDRLTIMAARWRITDDVVVDPAICFGTPVVSEAGIPTYVLNAEYRANGKDAEVVAGWYGVRPAAVLAAVRFEDGLAA
jgi:uncharacterized protein (DUF433 family)